MDPTADAIAPAVHLVTLGCAKNEVDTQAMARDLRACGLRIAESIDGSDLVIVNTCSFIRAATEESIEAVLDALDHPLGERASRPVVVCGCMPARYGDELTDAIPEATRFVPCSKEDDIAKIACELLGWDEASASFHEDAPSMPIAHLKISDGCDRWCSFCTIPQIRGRYHSFPHADILDEARALAENGTKEIVLIGQDTGIWGCDLPDGHDLSWLIRSLAEALPDVRFRLMYTEPEGVTDDLLSAIEEMPNICRYLDMPLQHVSPSILSDMRRAHSADGIEAKVEKIRTRVPGITLRTTLMCGFPGETEDDFEELVSFVRSGLFDYVGVFAYSQEEGTRAAELPDQVPEDIKELRARELRDEADSVSAATMAEREGCMTSVVIEGAEEDGQLYGRAECQAIDADGVTYVDRGEIGEVVDVMIDDVLLYDMEGTVL